MFEEKPWGFIKQFVLNQPCSVKLISLEPNQETSLHHHNLRDDMWVILDDGLEVQIGDKTYNTKSGEEYVIPAEQVHRIVSKGKKGRVLEVAFGFTDEEDNFRLEDDYGRKLGETKVKKFGSAEGKKSVL